MKHVDVEELVRNAVPESPTLTTRKDKLMYLATLVRQMPLSPHLLHNLEHAEIAALDGMNVPANHPSVFGLMTGDKHFQEAGAGTTIGSQMRHLELNQTELHEFSCDCGGQISKDDMANRIEKLANGQPSNQNPSILSRIVGAFSG